MRAVLISESLNFDRNSPPLTKMGVGQYHEIYEFAPEGKLFVKIYEESINSQNFTVVTPIRIQAEPSFKIKSKIRVSKFGGYKEFTLYLTKVEGIIMFQEWKESDEEVIIENLDQFIEISESRKKITESLDFERNSPPLTKMGVGQITQMEPKIKDILLHDKEDSESWRTIRRIVFNGEELIIECYAGSTVKMYLRKILQKSDMLKFLNKTPVVTNWGEVIDYCYEVLPQYRRFFKSGAYALLPDNELDFISKEFIK
jgi:hypothetical protein